MKKLLLFLLLNTIILSFSAKAQTRLSGYVVEINSGKQKVSGYIISSVGVANTATTKNKGQFTLEFPNDQPGKPAIITARKNGWQVVNPKELNTILPEKTDETPMKITVCKNGYLEKARKEYYEITDFYIKEEYNKRLKAIKKEKEGWQKERAALDEQLNLLYKQIREMADEYIMTNLDELNETERRAVQLFKVGKIDSSIRLRESLHSGAKLKKDIPNWKRLNSSISANMQNLKELAKEYMLTFDFDKAKKTYEDLTLADTTEFENVFAYANFLDNQNKFDSAIKWYQVCLRRTKTLFDTNPTILGPHLANIQSHLGTLYDKKNDFAAAEVCYRDALQISEWLFHIFPTALFEINVSSMSANLGALYHVKHDYQAAEAIDKKVLESLRRLTKTEISDCDCGLKVADILSNLGAIYEDKHEYDIAEAAYLEVIEILKQRVSTQVVYEPKLATALGELGGLYNAKQDYSTAESPILEAYNIFKRLAQTNPARYEPDLAYSQNILGILYNNRDNYPASEVSYREAFEIYKRLSHTNPLVYEPYLASVQNNLGTFYSNAKKDYPAAEKEYLEALEIYTRLAQTNPDVYMPHVASIQNNLGALYRDKNESLHAEAAFRKAMEVYTNLAIISPLVYEPEVAKTHHHLATLCRNKKDYPAAEVAYHQALDVYMRLAQPNPATYDYYVAQIQSSLGILYSDKHDYSSAEISFGKAYEIYIKYAPTNRELYNPKIWRIIILVAEVQKQDYNQSRQLFLDSNFNIAKNLLNEKNFSEKKEFLDHLQNLERGFQAKKKLIYINELEQKTLVKQEYYEKIKLIMDIIGGYRSLIDSGYSGFTDSLGKSYGNLAWYQLFEKQFANAEESAREALNPQTFKKTEGYDSAMVWVNTNFALALLFQGKYAEAEKIYLALKDKPYRNARYKETFLEDLKELRKVRITHRDVKKIRALLKQ